MANKQTKQKQTKKQRQVNKEGKEFFNIYGLICFEATDLTYNELLLLYDAIITHKENREK